MPDRASGFCVYNDVAVAIRWLLANGAKKVAYVDVDVHHGDGVERIFWDDPRVLTVSLHETGQMLFPGTGFPADSGGPGAEGSAVNVALPPGTSDAGWLRAFHAVVPPLLREFAPDVLVTQQGCDSHRDDPLAHLALSVDGQRASYLALHDLAHEVADGRWVAFGGGGYAIVDVVPRAWTHLLAVVSGTPFDVAESTPPQWRDEVRARLGVLAPTRMTDGREPGVPGLVPGLRPRRLAGPGDPGDQGRRVPLQRPRSADMRGCFQPISSGHADVSPFTLGKPWNIGHIWTYISPSAHVGSVAVKPWDVRKESAVRHAHEQARRHLRGEVPDRRGSRCGDARLEDDGVPPRPQR